MFETAVISVQHRRAPRAGLLTVSIAAHTLVVASLVFAGIQSMQLPTHAPNQFQLYKIEAPPPPMQAGSQQAHPAQQQARAQVKTPVPHVESAPQQIPEHVVPASNALSNVPVDPNAQIGDSQQVGVPDGVPNGVPPLDQQAQAQPEPPRVHTVAEVDSQPVAIKRVAPEFPMAAQRMRLSGWVVVEGVIDHAGHIRDPRVVSSSFSAFERPALDAVSQWEFKPGILRGQPVDTLFQLRVTFTLH